jgi:hypothetical protein
MKLRAEFEILLPDNADYNTIEDAKAEAERNIIASGIKWQRVFDKTERMNRTDLNNKCGSCIYFTLKPDLFSCSYGKCELGHKGYKTRSNPCCKSYERRESCTE